MTAAGADAGLDLVVPQVGTLCGLYLGTQAPSDDDGAHRTDEAAYARLFHALLRRGVAIAPGAYEVLFVGTAHTDAVLDQIVEAFADAAREVAAG